MLKPFLAALMLAGTAVLSGCGADEDPAATGSAAVETSEPPSTTPAGPATYSDIFAIRTAYEAAGYSCDIWEIRPRQVEAIESADCTSTMVFSRHTNASEVQRSIEARAEVVVSLLDQDAYFVVGPNWSAQCEPTGLPSCDQLMDVLNGGDVVEFLVEQ